MTLRALGLLLITGALLRCGKSAAPCTIEASGYDQSCASNSDCVGVPSGDLCTATCTDCTSAAISSSAQQQYQADLSRLDYTPRLCPCMDTPVYCNQGTCSLTAPADAGP